MNFRLKMSIGTVQSSLLICLLLLLQGVVSWRGSLHRSTSWRPKRLNSAEGDDTALVTSSERPRVLWEAAASSSVRVKETQRTTEQYLALPASQYSVLSASQITRVNDDEFKAKLGTLNFFGTKLSPILYVHVNVLPDEAKSEIIVNKAELEGGDVAKLINGSFTIYAINTVSTSLNKKGEKVLSSDTKVRIEAIVPPTKVPFGVIRRGGNFIIQSSLNLIVPTFVRILAADFKRWSAGNDERTEVDGAQLNLS